MCVSLVLKRQEVKSIFERRVTHRESAPTVDSVELRLRNRSPEAMMKLLLLLVISILGYVGGFSTVKLQTYLSTHHQLTRHQLTTAAYAIPSAVVPHVREETRFSKLRRWTTCRLTSSRLVKPCLIALATILVVLHPPSKVLVNVARASGGTYDPNAPPSTLSPVAGT